MASDAKLDQAKQALPLFAARLTPHRALSPKGQRVVIAILAVLAAVPGLVFSRLGAWPVFGFMGLDILAVWFALHWSFRDGRRFEQVTLWPDSLEILAGDPNGRVRRTEFNPFFVRLAVTRDYEERTTALHLRAQDRRIEIGAFLNPEDKAGFSKALGSALKRARA